MIGDVVIEGLAARFAVGDVISVRLRAKRDCRVLAINVDTSGVATVIFPNSFARSNRLLAGQLAAIPQDGAPFEFRARKRGRERVLAFCALDNGRVLGIRARFGVERFTTLGSWDHFLSGVVERRFVRRRRGKARRVAGPLARFGAVSVVEFDVR
ncbi:MAG: DUF4384 domain-containing protein [Hyphomicrobiaceae bacterium]|nr:DUF4384 domain-containing protein [Hyphomicrobiaceae bacterium]